MYSIPRIQALYVLTSNYPPYPLGDKGLTISFSHITDAGLLMCTSVSSLDGFLHSPLQPRIEDDTR
jgi:hypothetical protein